MIRIASGALGAIALAALTGCTSADSPQYGDALEKVHSSVGADVPENVVVQVREPVAMMFSENLEVQLKSFEHVDASLQSMPIVNTSAKNDANPSYLLSKVVEMLRRRYLGIALVSDLPGAARARKKTTLLIDIQATLGKRSGDTTRAVLVLIVFNERQQPVTRLIAQGSDVVPYPARDFHFRQAADQALAELETKMNTYVR